MGNKLVSNVIMPGQDNNYLVGGNVCNAFALGEIGSEDDFFLVAAEPTSESNYPMLTGNFLDSEGNVLFRLVQNQLLINPGNCSRILSDHIGYEIHDSAGHQILKVRTEFLKLPQLESECFVTTISAKCFDKNRNLVFVATSGEEGESLEASVKSLFGFNRGGGTGIVMGLSESQIDLAQACLATGGVVHEILEGEISDQEICLDGKMLRNATVTNCKLTIITGEFILAGPNNEIRDNEIKLGGPALNIAGLLGALRQPPPE